MTFNFVEKANNIHKNKYNYSLASYTGPDNKVIIICDKHGKWSQKARKHLEGQGCPLCARDLNRKPKSTTEEFISKSVKIHGDKYDYSKSIYEGWNKKLIIICKKHGEFSQAPHVHLVGSECPKCAVEFCKTNNSDIKEFIHKAAIVHGNIYDYSKSEYKGWNKKLIIICKKHGEFAQSPVSHISYKHKCPKCSNNQWDLDKFLASARIIHGDKYDYSEVDINNSKNKITIACKKCKTKFNATIDSHINRKSGCNKCANKIVLKDEFIAIANKIHNFKYDYSLVDFKNQAMKVAIICPDHGVFYQRPEHHMNYCGCPKCQSSLVKIKLGNF